MASEKTPETKPGWKTSEFWISIIATIAGLVLMSGVAEDGGIVSTICGAVLTLAAQLGYTGARTLAKAAEAKAKEKPKE